LSIERQRGIDIVRIAAKKPERETHSTRGASVADAEAKRVDAEPPWAITRQDRLT